MPSPDSEILVSADWIAAHAAEPEVRLVEIDVSPAAYTAGHIPGAVLWNAYSDLRDPGYQPVDDAALSSLFARSGISPESTVVVYGYGAPLGFWLLRAHGYDEVRMLPGSREQWALAGNDWSLDVPEPSASTDATVTPDAALLASRQVVEAAIDDPQHVLLDVRAESEYTGERFWPSGATEDVGRAGHIPSAVSVPIDLLHGEDGTLRSPAELRRVFELAGVTDDKTVITYCTIGNRASEAWFALKYLLGYPEARVYYDSWVEWGKAADTPVAS